jgi:penicillin-binding protein 2
VSGIEAQYEPYLRGVAGRQALSVDSKGTVVGTLSTTAPQIGNSVVLNIDAGLQQQVQNDLQQQIMADRNTLDAIDNRYPPAKDGAVVVMNPQNGQVLAVASYPSYDLNQWVGGISSANFTALQASGAENNNAIEGQYTPGSTFKLVTATAALQDGLWPVDKYYNDTGSFKIPGCPAAGVVSTQGCVLNDNPGDGTGEYNISGALTVSSDSFFYNLGDMFWTARGQYGDTPIQNEATAYGEGTITGIDLPGEAQGRLDGYLTRAKLHAEAPKGFPYPAAWYTGDNIEMAFGQGQTVLTPIEQAVAYSTFANGGTRYAPQVANEIVDPLTGKVIKKLAPQVTGRVAISPTNYSAMLQGFEGVVSNPNGTAYGDFQGFPTSWNLAGKTGTASNQQGLEPNSWFVAFGPNPNPTYLVLAVIDQGGYGAQAAAPLVRNIFNYLAANPVSPQAKTPTPAAPPRQTAPKANAPLGTPTTTTTTTTPGTTGTTGASTTSTTKPGP